jgi:hypothetical protein
VGDSGSAGGAWPGCIRRRHAAGRRRTRCGPDPRSRDPVGGARSPGHRSRRSTRRDPSRSARLGTSNSRSVAGRVACPRWSGSAGMEPGHAAEPSVGVALAASGPGVSATGPAPPAAGDDHGAARPTPPAWPIPAVACPIPAAACPIPAAACPIPAAACPAHLPGAGGLPSLGRSVAALGSCHPAADRTTPGVCRTPAARPPGVCGTPCATRVPGTVRASGAPRVPRPLRAAGAPHVPCARRAPCALRVPCALRAP